MKKKEIIETCRNLLFNALSHVLQDINGVNPSPVKEPPESLSYESNCDIGFLVKKCEKDGPMQTTFDHYFVAIAINTYPALLDVFDITKTGPDVYLTGNGKAIHLFNLRTETGLKTNDELMNILDRVIYDHAELLGVLTKYAEGKNKREDRKGRK